MQAAVLIVKTFFCHDFCYAVTRDYINFGLKHVNVKYIAIFLDAHYTKALQTL